MDSSMCYLGAITLYYIYSIHFIGEWYLETKFCVLNRKSLLQHPLREYVHLLGQLSSVAQLCPTLCDPMDCSTPDLPVHHQLPESTQTQIH